MWKRLEDLEDQAEELEHGDRKLINDRLPFLLYSFMKLTHSKRGLPQRFALKWERRWEGLKRFTCIWRMLHRRQGQSFNSHDNIREEGPSNKYSQLSFLHMYYVIFKKMATQFPPWIPVLEI